MEVKFPKPKTDTTAGEVQFASQLDDLATSRGLSHTAPVREYQFSPLQGDRLSELRFDQVLPGPSYLLPGEPLPLVTLPLPVTKEPYKISGIDMGMLYYRKIDLPIPVVPSNGLVVCCHGRLGMTDSDDDGNVHGLVWEYLARCLASNGFVVASIRHFVPEKAGQPKFAELARDQFLKHVVFLINSTSSNNKAAKFKLSGKPLALMGASEGAKGAIWAAQRIAAFAIPLVVTTVDAVVALAPTEIFPEKGFANSLLVLQGSHDGDTPFGAGSLVPYEWAKPVTSKHFIWIHGANHVRFLDTGAASDVTIIDTSVSDPKTQISFATQHTITQNYVLGFLKWRMLGDPQFRSSLVGDGTFAFHLSPECQTDFASGRLRVFPRYDVSPFTYLCEDPEAVVFKDMFQVAVGGIGQSQITANNPALFKPLKGFTLIQGQAVGLFGRQETTGYWLAWNTAKNPKPFVEIPFTNVNWSPDRIEFQAVLADSWKNPNGGLVLPTQLALTKDGKPFGYSKIVQVTIPPPLLMNGKLVGNSITRAVLSTIRIPTSLYQTPPLSSIAVTVR